MTARYKNAVCLILDKQRIYEYMGDDISGEKFIIASEAHSKRTPGFPVDSLSVHIETSKYYYDLDGYSIENSDMDKGFAAFFNRHLRQPLKR